MIHVYGIKNCNTMKKAFTWLEENDIQYHFHDYKKEPVSREKLQEWENKISWELLVNKKGTTWRKLSPEQQASVRDATSANDILLFNNSMIKRPVIEYPKGILLGFDEQEYSKTLR
ncbi:MAG: ArsC family reductase [Sphingobacterium sp.]|uniref:ArsC family reductase n=1 Tax=Sphingobacterium sp. JB170 TaxID=1434842 RepID=UPI0015C62705|nr:ArsC family reductase [Sphingobacterium sp. JB170]